MLSSRMDGADMVLELVWIVGWLWSGHEQQKRIEDPREYFQQTQQDKGQQALRGERLHHPQLESMH